MSLLDAFIEDDLLTTELKQPPSNALTQIFFAIRNDAPSGDGTVMNPVGVLTARQFNSAIGKYASAGNIEIRLSAGVFRTEGGSRSGSPDPFILQSGTKLIGAGMFNTIIHLEAVFVDGEREFPVIGGNSADNIEISDLTIDCALGDQPKTTGRDYAVMALKAIELNGRNNRIRRVRVINFGTRTPGVVNGISQPSNESFPIWNAGEGAITEDCLVEQPFESPGRETTVMPLSGPNAWARRNYIDTAFVNPRNGFPTRVTGLSFVGTAVTVNTQFPHNVKGTSRTVTRCLDLKENI